MTDDMPVARWQRRGRKGRTGTHRYTRWHVVVAIPADDTAQTACGIRYERRLAETGTAGDGELCRNCVRAMQTVPGKAAEIITDPITTGEAA